MYDIERIVKIIKDIESYKKELDEIKISSVKDLEDTRNFHAVSMVCFAILNRIIDLGQEILVKEKQSMPSRYADIFYNLSKAGVINRKETEEINDLIKYRNIISHTYFEIEKKDVFNLIKKINLIDNFVEKVKKRIKR